MSLLEKLNISLLLCCLGFERTELIVKGFILGIIFLFKLLPIGKGKVLFGIKFCKGLLFPKFNLGRLLNLKSWLFGILIDNPFPLFLILNERFFPCKLVLLLLPLLFIFIIGLAGVIRIVGNLIFLFKYFHIVLYLIHNI